MDISPKDRVKYLILHPFLLIRTILNGQLRCAIYKHNFVKIVDADENLLVAMIKKQRKLTYFKGNKDIEICTRCKCTGFPGR